MGAKIGTNAASVDRPEVAIVCVQDHRGDQRGCGLSLAVHVVGHASKRGLIPRVPSAEQLISDVERWLTADYPEIVRSVRRQETPTGEPELMVNLHPAAPEASVQAGEGGRVSLVAPTSAAGPGYHTFVTSLARRLATELSIDWGAGGPAEAVGDAALDAPVRLALAGAPPPETRSPGFLERQAVERLYLGWLGAELAAARETRRRGGPGVQLELRPGVQFSFDGAIATVLGPRDDAWLERAIGDPRVAINVTPWWADATDARYLLNRALCLLWTEVRWRPPIDPVEQALLDEVARLLWQAFPLDPSLAYPWREWGELLELRGVDEPAATSLVRDRSPSVPADQPLVGYRRRPVKVVHEGWRLEVPGSFAERRGAEEWWGGEASRSVTLAAVPTGTAGGPMPAEAFLQQVAGDLGREALTHQAGNVVGRARLGSDAESGVEVGVVEGYSAVLGSGAAVRIVFHDPADWQWALDTWRSLAPA
jgi:hypothetical protein